MLRRLEEGKEGDFSVLPESIRATCPLIAGEIIGLYDDWIVFEHLFMTDQSATEELGARIGPVMGKFMDMLQTELLIGISRLIDPLGAGAKRNLVLECLMEGATGRPAFAQALTDAISKIKSDADDIKFHRNKRIAHFDLHASLDQSRLPFVALGKIRDIIKQMTDLLNLVEAEFGMPETLS